MTDEHKHYWKKVGGHTWTNKHTLGRCVRKGCPAWCVLGWEEGFGPCPHSVGLEAAPLLEEVFADMAKVDSQDFTHHPEDLSDMGLEDM